MTHEGQGRELKQNRITQFAVITVACAVYAVAFNWFFDASHINAGGLTGVAQIINHYVPSVPIGTMTLALNIPLFLLGWKIVGVELLTSSLYATLVSSVLIDVLARLYTFAPMDSILAAIFGGVLLGVACGLMMLQNATTGGTEMAARLLKVKFERIPIGRICMVLDGVVMVAYAVVFRDPTRALYSMVALYILSLLLDKVVYGGSAAKVAYIISDEYEAITARLLEMDRGVTLLQGKGGYSGSDKHVILCAFGRNQIVLVKRLIREIDPDAFVIVCDAHEILGEGFGVYTPGGL